MVTLRCDFTSSCLKTDRILTDAVTLDLFPSLSHLPTNSTSTLPHFLSYSPSSVVHEEGWWVRTVSNSYGVWPKEVTHVKFLSAGCDVKYCNGPHQNKIKGTININLFHGRVPVQGLFPACLQQCLVCGCHVMDVSPATCPFQRPSASQSGYRRNWMCERLVTVWLPHTHRKWVASIGVVEWCCQGCVALLQWVSGDMFFLASTGWCYCGLTPPFWPSFWYIFSCHAPAVDMIDCLCGYLCSSPAPISTRRVEEHKQPHERHPSGKR